MFLLPHTVGVWLVTCMSRVEAFVTRIKIESSNQSPCLRAGQEIKVTSELRKSKDQECMAAI